MNEFHSTRRVDSGGTVSRSIPCLVAAVTGSFE
ncbi:hypothetical protein J2Z37_001783 [Ammoniphilus resinae]|uniref:Uncharacterized protein n=1 Tax=Ammoniphilus resinae TaxID=861532 RepID=A0ABS4GNT1_9BACL|nr:hypothetical protein [Ammoniphilus resinae]